MPGASSRAILLRHTVSVQAQSKAPDICSRAYTEELLASFNAQAQAPDDPPQTLVSDFHCCRCVRIWKSSRLLSTPKTKTRMIFTSRINSVIRAFSLKILTLADQNF